MENDNSNVLDLKILQLYDHSIPKVFHKKRKNYFWLIVFHFYTHYYQFTYFCIIYLWVAVCWVWIWIDFDTCIKYILSFLLQQASLSRKTSKIADSFSIRSHLQGILLSGIVIRYIYNKIKYFFYLLKKARKAWM